MNNNKNKTTKTRTQKQAAVSTESAVKAKTMKLGLDVHLDRYVVVRILDGGTPQPPQQKPRELTTRELVAAVARPKTVA